MTAAELQRREEQRKRDQEANQRRRRAKRQKPTPVARAAYTVPEFCEADRISRALFYNLLKNGRGPAVMHAAGRTLITIEAAAAWRAEGTKTTTTK